MFSLYVKFSWEEEMRQVWEHIYRQRQAARHVVTQHHIDITIFIDECRATSVVVTVDVAFIAARASRSYATPLFVH